MGVEQRVSEELKEIIENMPKDILINSFETVYEDSIKKDLEIKRLHSIIKEVREYIDYFLKEGHTKNWKQFEYSLLEILDKAGDEISK